MSVESIHQNMSKEDREEFERGAKLLEQVQAGKLFDDFWLPIGQGLIAVRRGVLRALHIEKAKGKLYNDAFGRMCAGTAYAEMHNVERSNLLFCVEHLAKIVEMRAGWTPTERAKINHPTSLAKRLREFFKNKQASGEEKSRKNASPMALLKEENAKLTKTNVSLVALVETLKQRDDFNPFDLKKDSAKDIAFAIVANVTVSKAEDIRAQLAEAIKAKKKQVEKQPVG